jgi:hypothetical protein
MNATRCVLFTLLPALLACGKPAATTPPVDPGAAPSSDPAAPASDPAATPDEEGTPEAPAEAPAAEDGGGEGGEGEAEGAAVAVEDPNAPAPVPEDPADGLTEPTSMASVKLEIKGEDGKVFKDKGKVIRWDQLTRIPIDFGSRMHEFDILLGQDKKSVGVQISYFVGGKEVLRKYRFDTKVGTREVIQIEGGVAVALTVTPKTIKPKPAAERDKVDAGGSRDPLAGAKK